MFENEENNLEIILFLFLFPLTLNSCKRNCPQNPKHALVVNYYEIINIQKDTLA